MGLKGNLSTVNLADVFQVLSRGSSTGLLRIQAPEGTRFVEIQNGAISIAGRSTGRIMLGDLLMSRGLIDDMKLETALATQRESGAMLGQVLIDMGFVQMNDLEEALRFQIEEEVCELFTLRKGDFDFLGNAALDARIAPGGGLVRVKIDPNSLLLEAARRSDEWKTIEQRVPSQNLIFDLTPDGQKIVDSGEGVSGEGLMLLRLVREHRTIESMVQKGCLGRLNTNSMLLELWDAGMAQLAPEAAYEKYASEHLALNRIEEAERVANHLALYGQGPQKKKGEAILEQVAKRKKQSSDAIQLEGSAEAKLKTSLVKRQGSTQAPNISPKLILKRERSTIPIAVGAVLALAGIGAALWFLVFNKSAGGGDANSRKALEAVVAKSDALILEGKFKEAWDAIRTFRSSDPEVQAEHKERVERVQADVEAQLLKTIEKFIIAQRDGREAELKVAAEGLEQFEGIEGLRAEVEKSYKAQRDRLAAFQNRLSNEKFMRMLSEIEAVPGTEAETVKKRYEELLAQNPPDDVAYKARQRLWTIARSYETALRAFDEGETLRSVGELKDAREKFIAARQAFPGSPLAKSADEAATALEKLYQNTQSAYELIEPLIIQRKTEEAQAELIKFISAVPPPPSNLTAMAMEALQNVRGDNEQDLLEKYKDAFALYDKDAEGARERLVDLLAKNPFSRMAARARMKVKVFSVPEGADVSSREEPGRATPAVLDLPATGLCRLHFKAEGYYPLDFVALNFREATLTGVLDRIPMPGGVRIPSPARGGIVALQDQILMADETEVYFCARTDLRPRRVSLRVTEPQPIVQTVMTAEGRAYIVAGKTLFQIPFSMAEPLKITLESRATSAPILYFPPQAIDRKYFCIASHAGLEYLDYPSGKQAKRVGLPGADSPPIGLAHDGERFFLPRSDSSIYAVGALNGERRWDAPLSARISGTPAVSKGKNAVAAVDVTGLIMIFDTATGKEKGRLALTTECALGCQALGEGFLVATKSGKLVSFTSAGTMTWTTQIEGEPLFAPQIVKVKDAEHIYLCASQGTKHYLHVLKKDGSRVWRARLAAKPVSVGFEGDRIFVSTDDADVSVFKLK